MSEYKQRETKTPILPISTYLYVLYYCEGGTCYKESVVCLFNNEMPLFQRVVLRFKALAAKMTRMDITEQKYSAFGHFSRSVCFQNSYWLKTIRAAFSELSLIDH